MTSVTQNEPTSRQKHPRGHGEGGIRQRPDGRWEATLDFGFVDGKRKRKYPYRKAEELEAEIGELEAKMMEMETSLTTPEVYKDGFRVQELMQDIADAQARLPDLYEHWEEATELNG